MAVRFQDQLGVALRGRRDILTYHPPDGMASQYKPADWICCVDGRYVLVEAKQCRTFHYPMSDWRPQQRHFCEATLAAGGEYLLVINWRGAHGTESGKTFAGWMDGKQALKYAAERATITQADMPNLLHWIGVKNDNWDVGPMLGLSAHLVSSVS